MQSPCSLHRLLLWCGLLVIAGCGGSGGTGGAGGGGGNDGEADGDRAAYDAGSFDRVSPSDLPTPVKAVIHSSPYAIWTIYDVAAYQTHQTNMEEVMDIL